MRKKKIPFTSQTYRAFLLFCDSDMAKSVISDMKRQRIKLTCPIYGALLDVERRSGNLPGMLSVLEMCLNDGLPFDKRMCCAILGGVEEVAVNDPTNIHKYVTIAMKLHELSKRYSVCVVVSFSPPYLPSFFLKHN
eukprot:TRINITY_DN2496_c0_g1_i8.p2 TRINITY_DN2496_c0_g1~~TRINITY_DN2496_c0_g1_i8.p2  ORF type:complete len:136 (+),score=17.57 TRINITY_DN2496_c0_g1_i8:758-1165(+)